MMDGKHTAANTLDDCVARLTTKGISKADDGPSAASSAVIMMIDDEPINCKVASKYLKPIFPSWTRPATLLGT